MSAAVSRIFADDHQIARVDATGRPVWRCQWSDVEEVAAWKYDLLVYDLICIGFRIKADAHYYQCCEEDQGWDRLLDLIERRFGAPSADWWERVSRPAFQENWTVIWKSAAGSAAR